MKKASKIRQQGFTLIELLVAVALVGAIGTVMFGVMFSIMRNTADNNDRVEAITGIEYAAHWISEDGMAAKTCAIGTNNDVLTLTWPDPEVAGKTYQVVYSLSGTDLQRQFTTITTTPPGSSTVTRTLADGVSDVEFIEVDTSGFNGLEVTIVASGGSVRISETREYYIALRLN